MKLSLTLAVLAVVARVGPAIALAASQIEGRDANLVYCEVLSPIATWRVVSCAHQQGFIVTERDPKFPAPTDLRAVIFKYRPRFGVTSRYVSVPLPDSNHQGYTMGEVERWSRHDLNSIQNQALASLQLPSSNRADLAMIGFGALRVEIYASTVHLNLSTVLEMPMRTFDCSYAPNIRLHPVGDFSILTGRVECSAHNQRFEAQHVQCTFHASYPPPLARECLQQQHQSTVDNRLSDL